MVVPPTSAEILKDTQGTYETTQTLWVDPVTGSIIDQSGSQVLMLESGTTVLDIEVAYTDKTVQANVDDAKANGRTHRADDGSAAVGRARARAGAPGRWADARALAPPRDGDRVRRLSRNA